MSMEKLAPHASAPLEGITVIDLTHVVSGPFTTMNLGDLGATVIKIEKPTRGDQGRGVSPFYEGVSHYFAAINRNKYAFAVDLKTDLGKQLLHDLISKGDVLVHNFRPGVIDGLGFGYSRVKEINPRLVFCEISGFGQYGPLRDRPAYDNVAQAMAGLMSLSGEPDGDPARTGFALGDYVTGLYAINAIVTALYHRGKTGQGQHLDVAMFDSLLSLIAQHFPYTQLTGHSPIRYGALHPNLVPTGSFRTSDGHIVLTSFNTGFWKRLCTAIAKEEWINDPRLATQPERAKHRDMVYGELKAIFKRKSTEEWEKILLANDIPHGPVRTVKQLLDDSNVEARGLLKEVGIGPLKAPIGAVKYSAFQQKVWKKPPAIGEDTETILREILGKSDAEVTEIMRRIATDKA